MLAGDLITPNCPVCNHDHAEGTTCHKCSHFRKMTKDPNAIIGVDYAAGAAGAGAGGPADAAICTPVTGAYAANSATRQNTTSSGSTVGYGGSSAVPVGWTPAAGAAGKCWWSILGGVAACTCSTMPSAVPHTPSS